MARGFIFGALWGGALGAGAVTVASIMAPAPQSPDVADAVQGEGQAPQEVALQAPETNAAEGEAQPQGQAAAPAAAPAPDTLALDADTVASPDAPQTGVAEALDAPQDASDASGVTTEGDAPVLPNPLALAPMEPQPADELSISTEPAQPPVPTVEEETAFAEEDPAEGGAEQTVAEAAETEELPEVVEDAPAVVADTEEVVEEAASAPVEAPETAVNETDQQAEAPVETQTEGTSEVAEVVEDNVAEEESVTAPVAEADTAPASEVTEAPAPAPDATAEADVAEAPEVIQEPEIAEAPATPDPETVQRNLPTTETSDAPQVAVLAPSARPQIGTPGISLTDRDTGVAINRIIASPQPEAEAESDDVALPSVDLDPRPIAQYAQSFENAENKPLMSIVLIDDGTAPTSGAAGIAALSSFPYTLSFAVDAGLPDAAERVALYRENGFEVLTMINLPEGAQAADAETALGVILPQMGEVVGVLEGLSSGLQTTRSASDQVNAILAETGHGLVTQSRGLNTMPKLAQKSGVPASPIFRDFDSKGQTATVIRRFLDQAAFRAGQEGAVIMQGRLQPDTISALLLWGLQDRAGQVALAPISAVLLSTEE